MLDDSHTLKEANVGSGSHLRALNADLMASMFEDDQEEANGDGTLGFDWLDGPGPQKRAT